MGWVYGIQSGFFIKVGATNNISERLKLMNLYNPHPCKVVLRRQSDLPYFLEKRMHEILDAHAVGREWFMVSTEQVREAYRTAEKDLILQRAVQAKWETESAERADKRAAEKATKEADSRPIKRRVPKVRLVPRSASPRGLDVELTSKKAKVQ